AARKRGSHSRAAAARASRNKAMATRPSIEPTNGSFGVGRRLGRLRALLLLCARRRSLVPLFLRHLLVLGGAVFRGSGPLLRRPFAPQRRVAHDVTGRLLATAEQLVEQTHVALPAQKRATKNARADEP